MNEQEYLEFPWSMEDTIENMKFIKEAEQERMLITNLDGMGEKDAEELGFDFDRAIGALEKQIPREPIALQHGDYRCPSCNRIIRIFEANNFCMFCGQAIDWGEEE